MNLEKLTKQLRRDLVANPKKAAALGVMVLVALYFWGPLVWKFMAASGNKRSSKANTMALILTDDPAEPTQQTKSRGGAKFRWDKVRQLIQQDPRMVSATFDPAWVDPFAKSAAAVAAEMAAEARPEPAAPVAESRPVDPSELGIVLGGVFVGLGRHVATINGEACHEGDTVAVTDKNDKAIVHKLRVAHIRRQAVVLELNGRTFTVELSAPKLAHGDEIETGKPRGSN